METENFWFDKPSELFKTSKLNLFIPTNDMSNIQKLNSILRFTIYFSLIVYFLKEDYRIFYSVIVVCLLTIFIHKYSNINLDNFNNMEKIMNNFELKNGNLYFKKNLSDDNDSMVNQNHISKKCIKPTNYNPFMNRNIFDKKFPNSKNCDYNSKLKDYNNWKEETSNYNSDTTIEEIVEDKFNINLYKNVGDIFDRNNSQRQYYTVASNTLPNNQMEFAQWLYNTPKTCKEGNEKDCNKENPNIVNAGLENLQLRYR